METRYTDEWLERLDDGEFDGADYREIARQFFSVVQQDMKAYNPYDDYIRSIKGEQ